MYDLIIIGGGPAGITAGIYASRKKLDTLLITKDFIGQTGRAFWIENYPGFKKILGIKLMEKMRKHLEKFSIDINEGEEVIEISKERNIFKIKTTQRDRYFTKAVILATGRDPRPLEVPGEKELIGRGVSYCPTCDGAFFKNKEIAIIGAGNSGFDAAIELTRYNNKIFILEFLPKIIADQITQERARKTGSIKVILNAKIKRVSGEEKVEGLIYEDLVSKKEKELKVQGVFIMIGQIPATGYIKKLVDFNEKDEIIVNPLNYQTKTPGLFAAGDVTNIAGGQIIIAAAQGAKAALSVYNYLLE